MNSSKSLLSFLFLAAIFAPTSAIAANRLTHSTLSHHSIATTPNYHLAADWNWLKTTIQILKVLTEPEAGEPKNPNPQATKSPEPNHPKSSDSNPTDPPPNQGSTPTPTLDPTQQTNE